MRKQNYLNNRDILKEIHKSKKTYCKFTTPENGDFDIILPGIGNINKTNIAEGRKLRAERLGRAAFDAAQAESSTKLKLDEFKVNTRDVPATDVVFRIMTFEHVPIDPTGGKKKKKEIKELFTDENQDITILDEEVNDDKPVKYTKCNFPPFFHYKVNEEGEPYLVGKSHWKGDVDAG